VYSNAVTSADECNSFFAGGASIKAHFASDSLGAKWQTVFDIKKNIVEKIVGEMMFNPEDDVNSDNNNNPCNDPNSLPPVLPHELVKLTAANFIRKIRQHVFQLKHRYAAGQIDVIADEHKTLLYAYQSESVLKEAIDSLSSRSSFKDGWSLLGSRWWSIVVL
jgi:hypothetical protein